MSTVANYRTNIFQFINFLNKHHPQITSFSQLKRFPHIEEWLTHLARKYSCNDTRRAHILCIRRFLNDIYDWAWEKTPKENLFNSKDIPPLPKYLPRPITPEDDIKLKETLKKQSDMLSLSILLLRNTGMRVGELRDLEINCIQQLPDGQYLLHVPLGKLKTERLVPVDEETADIVKRIIDMRELLLPLPNPKTGKPTEFLLVRKSWRRPSYTGLRAALARAVMKSGINIHITLHQLRHTYATQLLRGGIQLPVLMKLLGHKNISMTIRYTGVSRQDLQSAYHAALQKSNSLDLIPKPPITTTDKENQTNGPDYIFDGINSLIKKISSMGRDFDDKKNKKKLQRISERLRRVSKDIDDVIKP
jgi:site-specific recombinase XerD